VKNSFSFNLLAITSSFLLISCGGGSDGQLTATTQNTGVAQQSSGQTPSTAASTNPVPVVPASGQVSPVQVVTTTPIAPKGELGFTASFDGVAVATQAGVTKAFGGANLTATESSGGLWSVVTDSTRSPNMANVRVINGAWVATGANGYLATSTSGNTWSEILSPSTVSLFDSTYGNGVYVLTGTAVSGKHKGIFSGTSLANLVASGTSVVADTKWVGVVYGKTNFVAVGQNGQIISSTNGTNWSLTLTAASAFQRVAYISGKDLFVAVGNSGMMYTSNDGVNWTKVNGLPSANIVAIHCNSDACVAGVGIQQIWSIGAFRPPVLRSTLQA
jgi:hypothetical protein